MPINVASILRGDSCVETGCAVVAVIFGLVMACGVVWFFAGFAKILSR